MWPLDLEEKQKMAFAMKAEIEAPWEQTTGFHAMPAKHQKDKNGTRKHSGL